MLIFRTTGQFKKDFRKAQKRGRDLQKLRVVMNALTHKEPLSVRHREHSLSGNYKGRKECHVESDWLLIYKIEQKAGEIIFERTGSHSDLFE